MTCKFIFLVAIFSFQFDAFSQNTEGYCCPNSKETEYIDSVVKSLQMKGIDSIVVYQTSPTMVPIYDSTGRAIITFNYLIWEKAGSVFFQKFHNGVDSILSGISITGDTDLFNYLRNNFEDIFMNQVLPFTYKSNFNGIESYHYFPYHPHDRITTISVRLLKNNGFVQMIQDGSLIETLGQDWINLNYQYNKESKLVGFKELIEKKVGFRGYLK